MAGQALRAENLDSLRTRAVDYFMRVNRPVACGELARVLFSPRPGGDAVSPLLVRTLLARDERFAEAPREMWQLRCSPYMDLPLSRASFAVVDLEATGSRPLDDRIIEVGIVRIEGLEITERFESLVNPLVPIPRWIRKLTGIDESMLQDAPRFHQLAPQIVELLDGCVFVAHNIDFDYRFLRERLRAAQIDSEPWPSLCTVRLSRHRYPELSRFGLGALATHFDIPLRSHHRAVEDATATAQIFLRQLEELMEEGLSTVGQLLRLAGTLGRSRAC